MVADLPLQLYYYNVSLTANSPSSLNSGLLLQKAERYRNNKMKHIFLHQVEPGDDEDAAAAAESQPKWPSAGEGIEIRTKVTVQVGVHRSGDK